MKIVYSSTGRTDRLLSFQGDNFHLDIESEDIDKLKYVLQKACEIDDIVLISENHEMLFSSDDFDNIKLPEQKVN